MNSSPVENAAPYLDRLRALEPLREIGKVSGTRAPVAGSASVTVTPLSVPSPFICGSQEITMESRRITAGVGLLFTALGAWIAFEVADDWPAYLAAIVVGGLGIDGIYSAIRGRRALISRIGPLP